MAAQVATAVLIIACPCAVTLAAPITLGTGMGVLGRAWLLSQESPPSRSSSAASTRSCSTRPARSRATAAASVERHGLSDDRVAARRGGSPPSRCTRSAVRIAGCVDRWRARLRDVRETPGQRHFGRRRRPRGRDRHAAIRRTRRGHDVGERDGRQSDGRPGAARADSDGAAWISVDGDGRMRFGRSPERAGLASAIRTLKRSADVWLLSGDHGREASRWAAALRRRGCGSGSRRSDKLALVRGRCRPPAAACSWSATASTTPARSRRPTSAWRSRTTRPASCRPATR